jgi:hypothetical protein
VSDAGPNLTLVFSDVWATDVSMVEEVVSAIHLHNVQQSHVSIDGYIV